MTEFKVRLYNMGIWDGREPKAVAAPSALQAAEQACGERLGRAGTLGKLRAEAWPTSNSTAKETFYSV
jgi:hypothetical protein